MTTSENKKYIDFTPAARNESADELHDSVTYFPLRGLFTGHFHLFTGSEADESVYERPADFVRLVVEYDQSGQPSVVTFEVLDDQDTWQDITNDADETALLNSFEPWIEEFYSTFMFVTSPDDWEVLDEEIVPENVDDVPGQQIFNFNNDGDVYLNTNKDQCCRKKVCERDQCCDVDPTPWQEIENDEYLRYNGHL